MHSKNSFFREHNCVQITTLIPDTIGKCSLERVHLFLTKVVLLKNNCFIHYNAPPIKRCQGSAIDKFVLLRVTGILSTLDQPHCL